MNYLEIKDLQKHKLSVKIFDVIEKKLNGRGFPYFDKNLDFNSLLDQIFKIYFSFYLIETTDFDVLKFKNKYKNFKKDSFRGEILITPQNKDGNISDRKVNYYSGEYTFFLVLFYNLFSRLYKEQIAEQKLPFYDLNNFFQKELSSLVQAPNCYIIMDSVDRIMDDGDIDYEDFKLYVKEITGLIKERKSNDKEIIEKIKDFDVEELSSKGQKVMFMMELGIIDFLIKKFDLGKSNSQLSNVIHCYTGLGVSAINSIINPIYNTSNDQKNNPYTNKKNIIKIEAKMIELSLKKS